MMPDALQHAIKIRSLPCRSVARCADGVWRVLLCIAPGGHPNHGRGSRINQHCHVLCNHCSQRSSYTLPFQDRMTMLRVLQGGPIPSSGATEAGHRTDGAARVTAKWISCCLRPPRCCTINTSLAKKNSDDVLEVHLPKLVGTLLIASRRLWP